MGMLLFVGTESLGGFASVVDLLYGVEKGYMHLSPDTMENNYVTMGGFAIGWLFGGVGVIGQPHIMIRYMALDDPAFLNRMRFYYYSWFLAFYTATVGVGLLSRAAIPDTAGFDPETVLLHLSDMMLVPVLVGVMLAGLCFKAAVFLEKWVYRVAISTPKKSVRNAFFEHAMLLPLCVLQ